MELLFVHWDAWATPVVSPVGETLPLKRQICNRVFLEWQLIPEQQVKQRGLCHMLSVAALLGVQGPSYSDSGLDTIQLNYFNVLYMGLPLK